MVPSGQNLTPGTPPIAIHLDPEWPFAAWPQWVHAPDNLRIGFARRRLSSVRSSSG